MFLIITFSICCYPTIPAFSSCETIKRKRDKHEHVNSSLKIQSEWLLKEVSLVILNKSRQLFLVCNVLVSLKVNV